MALGGGSGAKLLGTPLSVPLKTHYGSYFYHVDIQQMAVGGTDLGASSNAYNR